MTLRSTNLASWFLGGGTRARELADTRRAWEDTQRFWHGSPLGQTDPSRLAIALMKASLERTERTPTVPVLVAVCEAAETLLRAESIGDIEPYWSLIEADVEVATGFRQVIANRKRWSADFGVMHDTFSRLVLDGLEDLYKTLPELCFGAGDTERADGFEVPLIDLIADPAAVVDRLFILPYADDAFRLNLFAQLRAHCSIRLLIASGLRPDANPRAVEHKLVRAPKQKDKTGAELAELYLDGSPLKGLLDVPVPFRIPEDLRFEHCHIVGGTGHGKTQLMQKMILADLEAARRDGRSVIVIDSQGDLINKLQRLELFSPDVEDNLADRLVLIDPSDVEYPAALNLFDAHLDRVRHYSPADKERVLNGVIELYELFFGAFLGAELTQKQGVVFKYLARLMLAIPDATIHTLMHIMEDGRSFKSHMEHLDGSARYFFETEFFHPSFAATKKQVLRRLWGVLSTPAFERMFTQPRNKLDLFEAMNEGKIILVSTAKDLLKREGSQLLGRFFIAMITQAALERSTLKEYLRQPCFVYVDEAQEYFDDNIETILNQARKYRVGLTLAHQTLDQLSPRLRSAILANTSMKCAGGVSAKDARALAEEFRTTPAFIERMKRSRERTEFALWVKQLTGQAIRLSVPLGFLERQPTLADEDFAEALARNRERYCGTLAALTALRPSSIVPEPQADRPSALTLEARVATAPPTSGAQAEREPERLRDEVPATIQSGGSAGSPAAPPQPEVGPRIAPRDPEIRPGKGGKDHRYLQALIKQLAEEYGLRASIEAGLPNGLGQVDVLLERDGVVAAVEISVSTPVEHERSNLRKCLDAGYPRIGVVLAKSKKVQASYKATLIEGLSAIEREKVSFMAPEEIPDFIAAVVPPDKPREKIVKGYKVKVSETAGTPEDAKARQTAIARIIAQSLARTQK